MIKNIYKIVLLLSLVTGLYGAVPGTPDLITDTGSDTTDNITNDDTPTFTGTRDINDTITLYIDGTEVGTDNSTDSDTWTITPSSAIADVTDVNVTAEGNDGNSTELTGFTLDTVISTPSVELVEDTGSDDSDNITNNSDLNVTNIDANTVVEYTLDDGSNWSSTAPSSDGTYTLKVRETDIAGNSAISDSITYTIDKTINANVPFLNTDSDTGASNTDGITYDDTPTFTGDGAIEDDDVTLYIDGNNVGSATVDANGQWSITSSALGDGTNLSVRIDLVDIAGNTLSINGLDITIDTTISTPFVALMEDTGSASDDNITNNSDLNITNLDDSTVVEYTLDNGTTWSDTEPTEDGNYTLKVRQTDIAGNIAISDSIVYIIDKTQGVININIIATDGKINLNEHNQTVTVSGTTDGIENDQTVNIKIYDYVNTELKSFDVNVSNDSYSYDIAGTDIEDLNDTSTNGRGSQYSFRLQVSDVAGNTVYSDQTVTVDLHSFIDANTTTKTLSEVDLANDLIITGNTDIESGQTISLNFHGTTYTTTNANGSTFSITVPSADIADLVDGTSYPIEFATDMTDLAGNTATVTNSSIVYDKIADVSTSATQWNIGDVDITSQLHDIDGGDTDFYKITLPSRGYLTIDTNDSNISVTLHNYDNDDVNLTDNNSAVSSFTNVMDKGTYYFKIKEINGESKTYTVTPNFTEFALEQDLGAKPFLVEKATITNSIDAKTLKFINESPNYIQYNGDSYFDVTDSNNISTKTLTATTIAKTTFINTTLKYYNVDEDYFVNGAYLYTISNTNGLNIYDVSSDDIKLLEHNATITGTSIVVNDRYVYIGSTDGLKIYDIRQDFRDTISTSQSYDTYPLDLNISFNNYAGELDTDIFKIVVDKFGTLDFTTSDVNSDLNLTVSLDEDFSTTIKDQVAFNNTTVSISDANASTYYVKIMGNNNIVDGKYYLQITQDNTDLQIDKVKNIISIDDNLSISSNEDTISGTLQGEGDIDLYKISITQDGVLELSSTQTVGLYTYEINASSDFATPNEITARHLSSGTYYIKVSYNDATDYSITTKFTADTKDSDAIVINNEDIQTFDLPIEGTSNKAYLNIVSNATEVILIDDNVIKSYDIVTKRLQTIDILDAKDRIYLGVKRDDDYLYILFNNGTEDRELKYDISQGLFKPIYIAEQATTTWDTSINNTSYSIDTTSGFSDGDKLYSTGGAKVTTLLAGDNDILYVGTDTKGVYLYDISTSEPKYLKSITTIQNVQTLKLFGNKLYILGEVYNSYKIAIADTTFDYSNYKIGSARVALDQNTSGLLPLDDVDYFQISLNSTADFNTTVSGDVNCSLYNDINDTVYSCNESNLTSGIYYLKFVNNDLTQTTNYSFVATQEFDDYLDTMNFVSGHTHTILAVDTNITGTLSSSGDIDFIKIELDEKSLLSINGIDASYVKLYYEGGSEVSKDADGKYQIPYGGTYYIEVSGFDGSYTFSYSLDTTILSSFTDNSTSPSQILSTIPTNGAITYVKSYGNYLFALDSVDGLIVVDVTDGQNPVIKGKYVTYGTPKKVLIDGTTAYISEGSDGLEIVDLGDIQNIQLLSQYNDNLGEVSDTAIDHNSSRVYLASGTSGMVGLNIENILEPSKATNTTSTDIRSVVIDDRTIYATDFNSGVKAYNLDDISATPTSVNLANANNMILNKGTLYVSANNDLVSYSIDGTTVSLLNQYSSSEAIVSMNSVGENMYLMGATTTELIDISTPTTLKYANKYDFVLNYVDSSLTQIYYGKNNSLEIRELLPDYSDTFLYAEPITEFPDTIKGEISLNRTDDRDIFKFSTDKTGILTLVSSVADVSGKVSIYDVQNDGGMALYTLEDNPDNIAWDTITPRAEDSDVSDSNFSISSLTLNDGTYYIVIEDANTTQTGGNYEFSVAFDTSGDKYVDNQDAVAQNISVTGGVIEDSLFGTSGDEDYIEITVDQRSVLTFTHSGDIKTRITLYYPDGQLMVESTNKDESIFEIDINPGTYKVKIDAFEDGDTTGDYKITMSSVLVDDILVENGLSSEDIIGVKDVKYLGNYIYVLTDDTLTRYTHLLRKITQADAKFISDETDILNNSNANLFTFNSLDEENKIINYIGTTTANELNPIVSSIKLDTLETTNIEVNSNIAADLLPYLKVKEVSYNQRVYMYDGSTLQVRGIDEVNANMRSYPVGDLKDIKVISQNDGSDIIYLATTASDTASIKILKIESGSNDMAPLSEIDVGTEIDSMYIDIAKSIFYVGVDKKLVGYDMSDMENLTIKTTYDFTGKEYEGTPSDIYARDDKIYTIIPATGIVILKIDEDFNITSFTEVLSLGQHIDNVFSMDHRTVNYTTYENNTTRLKIYFFEDSFLDGETDGVLTGTANGETPAEGCFIATAGYGSYFEPNVKILRDFRDTVLLTNDIGREFVKLYYRYSPSIANVIAQNESLKTIVRVVLTPIVYIIKYPLWSLFFMLMMGLLMMQYYRKKGVVVR